MIERTPGENPNSLEPVGTKDRGTIARELAIYLDKVSDGVKCGQSVTSKNSDCPSGYFEIR